MEKEYSIGKEVKILTTQQRTYFNSLFQTSKVELGDVYVQLCHEDDIVGGVLFRDDQIIASKDFIKDETEFIGIATIKSE